MGFETLAGTSHQYGLISFDSQGRERAEGAKKMSDELLARLAQDQVSNVFFFCHGWKGDVPAAKAQYAEWIGALVRSADMQRTAQFFPNFSPLFVGLHWPSQPWGDEELRSSAFGPAGTAGPQDLLQSYLDRLGDTPEIRAALTVIIDEARHNVAPEELPSHVREAYLKLNDALGLKSEGLSAPPDADREVFDPDEAFDAGEQEGHSFGGGSQNLGGLLGPLRQLSYWTMKKRARAIGEGGMHEFLKNLQRAAPHAHIHLMGHSFGTIVVSGMVGGADARGALLRPVDSVVLVQGAVSLWCYAASIPYQKKGPGYFARILADGKVSGPIVTTQSRYDAAVGTMYPLASRIKGSVDFAPGKLPEYGAIGTFGLQGVSEAQRMEAKMLPADGSYAFAKQRVYNIESSQFICKGDGISGAHSDIAGPEVAHLIWEAAFASA